MNVNKLLVFFLTVIVAGAAFIGAASAFNIIQDPVESPSDPYVPGQEVTANMKITLPAGSNIETGSITFSSDLNPAAWTVQIISGGDIISEKHPTSSYPSISGFDLAYKNTEITLAITVVGNTPYDSTGSDLHVIKLSERGGTSTGAYQDYLSPGRKVYDTSKIPSTLTELSASISSLDRRIYEYTEMGCDCTDAKTSLELARSKYDSAQREGVADGATAYANIDAANSYIASAEKSLANYALSFVQTYTTKIDANITELYSKGMNTEAKLLDTKNSGLKNSYSQYLNTYQAGNLPAPDGLETLMKDCIAVDAEGAQYLSSSSGVPFIGGITEFLPFILIGVGVVVIGIIVFLLIRRRRSSWDELG